jgi:hypothetical protein
LKTQILIAGAGRVSWIAKKKKRVFPGLELPGRPDFHCFVSAAATTYDKK